MNLSSGWKITATFTVSSRKVMEEFLHDGQDLLLDIEPRGARKIKQKFKGGIYVFVLPPSRPELLKTVGGTRLRNRWSYSKPVRPGGK